MNDADEQARVRRFAERMTEFMKISKNCQFGEGCFSKGASFKSDGTKLDDNYYNEMRSNNFYMVILADGSSLGFGYIGYYKVRVDIDGPNKGKNQIGNDLFDFAIDEEQNILLPSLCPNCWEGSLNTNSYSTAWVIKNGNLDYLKCNDLNWETKTSCK